MRLTIIFFVSVLPLSFPQPVLHLTNCSLNIPCQPRLTPASAIPKMIQLVHDEQGHCLGHGNRMYRQHSPWNPSSFRMIVLRTSGRVFFTFPAVSRTAITPYGRPGMRPSTLTPLQPHLPLVKLCIFPAVVSSVPPARPATM